MGRPRGSCTRACRNVPPRARCTASTVPSPPSASGTTSSARGWPSSCAARGAPSTMASAAAAALRLPLNGAGAISTCTAGSFSAAVALDRQLHQTVDQRGVGQATGGPQQREHAGGREAGDGVDLADVELVIPAEQEVDARHAGAVDGQVRAARKVARALGYLRREIRRHDEVAGAGLVLCLEGVKGGVVDVDLANDGHLGLLVAQHAALNLTRRGCGPLYQQAAVVVRGSVKGRG